MYCSIQLVVISVAVAVIMCRECIYTAQFLFFARQFKALAIYFYFFCPCKQLQQSRCRQAFRSRAGVERRALSPDAARILSYGFQKFLAKAYYYQNNHPRTVRRSQPLALLPSKATSFPEPTLACAGRRRLQDGRVIFLPIAGISCHNRGAAPCRCNPWRSTVTLPSQHNKNCQIAV